MSLSIYAFDQRLKQMFLHRDTYYNMDKENMIASDCECLFHRLNQWNSNVCPYTSNLIQNIHLPDAILNENMMTINDKQAIDKFCDKSNYKTSADNLDKSTTSDRQQINNVQKTDSCTPNHVIQKISQENFKPQPPITLNTQSYTSFDVLLKLVAHESELLKKYQNGQSSIQIPRSLRLCGGGEQALNNGTSGWGSPPTGGSIGKL